MKFRIKKFDEGFMVQVLKCKWFGRDYYTHYISYTGLPKEPYYFSSYDKAEEELLLDIKWKTIQNSKYC